MKCRQHIKFQHIHKEGVGCILADLDSAQAKGLGLALHDLDHKRDWETHLTFIFKSCLVHFERYIYNLIPLFDFYKPLNV
jgi:hypothetical protein